MEEDGETKDRRKEEQRGKEKRKRCLLHLLLIVFLFHSFFPKSCFTFSLSLSLSLSYYGTVGRHGASRPKALEAIPRRRVERERERELRHSSRRSFYFSATVWERALLSLSLSLFLCRSPLARFTGPCVPSFSLSHALPRLSLDFARLGSLFPLSPSFARGWTTTLPVCAPRTLPDGGHVADHGGGAKGTSWELYHATVSDPTKF